MSDQTEVMRIVGDCDRYWRETGVPKSARAEMTAELQHHLLEAAAEGRSPEQVIGPDLAGFAEAWASEQRPGWRPGRPSWEDVASGTSRRVRHSRWFAIGYVVVVVGVVALATLADGGGEAVGNEIWRWLWTGLAVVMAIGEIFTAAFFLLPFAVGAAGAAFLAWVGASVLVQWLVFFIVSLASLAYMQRYIRHQDDGVVQSVGANRYLNAHAVVLETVDPSVGTGMVRVESEEWRATSAGEVIEAGTPVRVTAVSGSRLVVAAGDDQ